MTRTHGLLLSMAVAAITGLFAQAPFCRHLSAAAVSDRTEQSLSEARNHFDRGEFERGIELARAAADLAQRDKRPDQELTALLLIAEGYQELGRHTDAMGVLERATKLAVPASHPDSWVQTRSRLAIGCWRSGEQERAHEILDEAMRFAATANRADLQASLLNDLGTIRAETGQMRSASVAFAESARLARAAGLALLEATAIMNAASVRIRDAQTDGLDEFLGSSLQLARKIPDSRRKGLYLVSAGSQFWLSQWLFALDASWRTKAYEAYAEGLSTARAIGDQRTTSFALGFIGRLYEDERRYDEALRYTRQASVAAQLAEAKDALYVWEWQLARIMRELGNTDAAVAAYRRAIRTLEEIRSGASRTAVSFQTAVGPLFREFADLLLRRQSGVQDLLEVRTTLERLRQAEVADYFRDNCVVLSQASIPLEAVSRKAAVIYPVLLSDRTELLVSLPAGLERFTVAAGLEEVAAAALDLRRKLEAFDQSEAFMAPARRMHELLIRPIENSLRREGIETLVVVPDGPLRSIPLAALHDGRRFLVEGYAVVTSPGLTLTVADSASRAGAQALAGGLTVPVQGFSPLPNVAAELAGIQSLFPTTRLQDDGFRTAGVERAVAQGGYSIVHLATHGHFDREHDRSFLVTFDGRFTMDRIEDTVGRRRYGSEPLDLLVLSACETAVGDDRAALGLAGVGLKAGARSVLASLWSISDESTALLIGEFYKKLKDPGTNKAEALRAAQLALLGQQRFRHPYYWAAFLLIGNWL